MRESSEGVDEGAVFLYGWHAFPEGDPMMWVYWSWNWLTPVLVAMYQATRRLEKLGMKCGVLSMLHCSGCGFVPCGSIGRGRWARSR